MSEARDACCAEIAMAAAGMAVCGPMAIPLWAVVAVALASSLGGAVIAADWPQFGGPTRDFTATQQLGDVRVADTWPEDGPRRLWSRPLGDAYAGIVAADGCLYTMFRSDGEEHAVALAADDGRTLWDQHAPAPYLEGTNVEENGPGPHATPAIAGERLVTVGVTGAVHCLDRRDGAVVWQRSLADEFGGTRLFRGYSASPLVWQDTVVLPVGGAGHAVVALRLADGAVAWQRHDFDVSHVAPLLIRVDGQAQLVVVGSHVVFGLDPASGELLWQHEHPMSGDHVATMPIWDGQRRLFFSGAYGEGSRALELVRQGERTAVEELWHNPRMRVHHSNVVHSGDYVYGPSGDFTAILLSCLNVATGEVAWQDRRIGRASCLLVGDRLLLLQEDGQLFLAASSPEGLEIKAQCRLFDARAWTAPTLVGNQLYVRNRTDVMAYELPTVDSLPAAP
jgi:outer membrane protein assembly factor BamB